MAIATIKAVTWGGDVTTTCSSTPLTTATIKGDVTTWTPIDIPRKTHCESCGAPLKIDNDYCEYCGTIC